MARVSTNAWVVGLKQGNLDALFLEEALCLSKIQWRMVRRGVPETESCYHKLLKFRSRNVLPVGEERDLVSRHLAIVPSRTESYYGQSDLC